MMIVRGLALVILFLGACNRTPEPPGGEEDSPATERVEGTSGAGSGGGTSVDGPGPSCEVAMTAEAPPKAESVAECPTDPSGRPVMPMGTVAFDDAPGRPMVRVELALTEPHRQHGLMYRPTLSDEEGMLFTFGGSAVRTFWMHNTCLALDMLFIEESGYISGVLEQVPPWNDDRRSIACPVKHVLELRAGWARDHGITPGQRVSIEGPTAN